MENKLFNNKTTMNEYFFGLISILLKNKIIRKLPTRKVKLHLVVIILSISEITLDHEIIIIDQWGTQVVN